jgi:hypothetical protein
MSVKDSSNLEIYSTYAEFWPFYLHQHSLRKARMLHIIGIFLALLMLEKAIFCLSLIALIMAPVFGYGFAWAAHFFVEKNQPATFTYPLWSLRGDFHMFMLWATGRLEAELVQHQILT